MFHLILPIIYIAFISLGLPDALLGSAWPLMCSEFDVPVSRVGFVFIIISLMAVLSSLLSDRLTRRFGTGKATAASVSITAVTLPGSPSALLSGCCAFVHLSRKSRQLKTP